MTLQTSKFSWRRVWMFYRYNAPGINKQLITYLLISLVGALVFLFSHGHGWQMGVYTSFSIMLMFILSPLVFTRGGDSRIVERLIPAGPMEKMTFYMVYLLVVIPASCFALPWLAEQLYLNLCPADMVEKLESHRDMAEVFAIISILSAVAAMMTCFFCVVYCRSNRGLKAMIWAVVVEILFSVAGTIHGSATAFMAGYNEARGSGPALSDSELTERITNAMDSQLIYNYTATSVVSVYILVMIWLSYRAISRRNL